MEIRFKKCKSGNIWKFVNESWSNSNGWGHKTTIFENSYEYESHKVRYYNRTWESYTYQTCMSGAIETIYENAVSLFIEDYKNKNSIIRFKPGQREEVVKLFNETILGQDLLELKEAISNREFSNIEIN